MKSMKLLLAGALAALFAGCATESGYDAMPKEVPPEPPLSEIPDYPEIGEVAIPAEGISVYSTLWYHDLLKTALAEAGYRVVEFQDADGGMVVLPGKIVEPMTIRHAQEVRAGEKWLYTRITVQVRRPIRAMPDDGLFEDVGKPRLFQAYSRTNLGAVSVVSEEHYRDNTKVAIFNLMKVRPFREAL